VDPCQWLTAHRQRVRYLTLTTIAPGTDKYTCTEPADQPTYVVELSNECSTFNGDHGTFGTTGSALKKRARAPFQGVHETATIDGRPVNIHQLVAATAAFPSTPPTTTEALSASATWRRRGRGRQLVASSTAMRWRSHS
jgi:hypothetical protein